MNILHLVNDSKFIDDAYHIFESVYPGSNTFISITGCDTLKYIKIAPVQIVSRSTALRNKFLNELKQYDIVVLHFLDFTKIQLVARAVKSINFVWIGWGADYYDLISKDENALLHNRTRTLKRNIRIKTPITILTNVIKQIVKRLLYRRINKLAIINRINYFAPVLHEDYELVRRTVKDFRPAYLSWNYGNLEDNMLVGIDGLTLCGNNILLGNSATETNNHLDIFDMLSSVDLANRKLLCPLSYGAADYRDAVVQEGIKQFGSTFVPLTDFIPMHEYTKLLCTCSIGIMGHLRQQALGNIIILMYLGAKVFLDKANPVYHFLKKEGAYVYSLEELASEHMIKLESHMIKCNRDILHLHWSRKTIQEKTFKLITSALSNNTSDVIDMYQNELPC